MDPNLVVVEATAERYRALCHQPSGTAIDAETGRGLWPADQFTYALRDEGSIRLVDSEEVDEVERGAAERDPLKLAPTGSDPQTAAITSTPTTHRRKV